MSEQEQWVVAARPGYAGKNKDVLIKTYDQMWGYGGWKLVWEKNWKKGIEGEEGDYSKPLNSDNLMDFNQVFYEIYVAGYAAYFQKHRYEAKFIAQNYSFTYDKDLITKEQAFDQQYLYMVPGRPNQFHHVALNIALVHFQGLDFLGTEPLKVREGRPGTDKSTWPAGWKWGPGRIPAVRPGDINPYRPYGDLDFWWQGGTIEHFYQNNKILAVKESVYDNQKGNTLYNILHDHNFR